MDRGPGVSVPDLLSPIRSLSGSLSPIDLALSLTNPVFGEKASVDFRVAASLRQIGQRLPLLPLTVLQNGQRAADKNTDLQGEIAGTLTFTEPGVQTIEALPTDPGGVAAKFGPFVPYTTRSLPVYGFTPQAVLSCSGEALTAAILVNRKGFSAGQRILFPSLDAGPVPVGVEFPLTLGNQVYALENPTGALDLTGDTELAIPYNGPKELTLTAVATQSCAFAGSPIPVDVRLGLVDVCGLPFPNVPLNVSGTRFSTDAEGKVAGRIQLGPGSHTIAAFTDTPILARAQAPLTIPTCPPPPYTYRGQVRATNNFNWDSIRAQKDLNYLLASTAPYPTGITVQDRATKSVVSRTATDPGGRFSLSLGQGEWLVTYSFYGDAHFVVQGRPEIQSYVYYVIRWIYYIPQIYRYPAP